MPNNASKLGEHKKQPTKPTEQFFLSLRTSLQQLCVGEDLSVLPATEEAERRREEAQRADEEVEARQRQGHLAHQDLKSGARFKNFFSTCKCVQGQAEKRVPGCENFFRQVEAKVVGNSGNKLRQT